MKLCSLVVFVMVFMGCASKYPVVKSAAINCGAPEVVALVAKVSVAVADPEWESKLGDLAKSAGTDGEAVVRCAIEQVFAGTISGRSAAQLDPTAREQTRDRCLNWLRVHHS